MNEIERDIQLSLNHMANSVAANPHLESRAWNQITSRMKPKKPFRPQRIITVALLLSVILIVGTAYAEPYISKIKLLAYIGHVPIFSKQNVSPSSVNLALEQEKRLASDNIFNDNKVDRTAVERMSPVPFILPTLPKGYELTEEFGIPGSIAQQIREGKLEKSWLQKDGSFSYYASFSKANADPIVIQYNFDSRLQMSGSVELRYETDIVELEGHPVTLTDRSSTAWIELKDGAVLRVHISGPESYSSKERNNGLKEILKKLNLK
jgi:hypothetical protein